VLYPLGQVPDLAIGCTGNAESADAASGISAAPRSAHLRVAMKDMDALLCRGVEASDNAAGMRHDLS
jgi:hypothetical protein